MPDIEPIKGKVIIEYDGSGVDAAKKDLSSLADIVGGGLEESVGSANDALAGLDEQMAKNADSTATLTSSVESLANPISSSSDAVSSMTDVLGAHQAAIEDVSTAFEEVQKPIEAATTLMEDASPPMAAIAKNAESMQTQMVGVNAGFAQMSQTLPQSVALMPQLASGIHDVAEEFDPKAFGLDTFNENWSVFQDAMSNPYPFQMIHQYLGETGQTWDDFSSSIGDSNSAILDQMAAMPVVSNKAFESMSSGAQGVGQSFVSAAGDTEAFNKQWNDVAASVGQVGQAGGLGTVLLGPEDSWSKLDASLSSTQEGINKLGGVGKDLYGPEVPISLDSLFGDISGGIGKGVGGFLGALNQIAMPLMAVQMIGMAVGAVGQGIYNMAALAEGPAAHSVGSFTGAIDVLGQHAQQAGEQFSEGLGQGIKPMIDAMNNVSNGQTADGWNVLGESIGVVGNLLGSVGQIAVGGIMDLPWLAFTPSTNTSSMPGNNIMQQGWEGLQNLWANITGGQEPFPTTGGLSQAMSIQAQLNQSIPAIYAQANDPQYLAAQAYMSSQAGYATLGQTRYDVSHTSGMSPFDYTPQAYQNSVMGAALANGGSGYGLSGVDLNRAFFGPAAQQAAIEAQATINSAGCFPAGTPVLLADGTEQAIETLHVGEQVLARDGTEQVTTTILALIKPPPRCVYRLVFSDGNTLTLTDSHPISTSQGWKSLSPDATRKENPDLPVTALRIGDCIHTVDGTCTLLAIEPREIVQVYNITVDAPHTFYASSVLVHNKALGSQVMTNVANSDVPAMDMKNSNLIQSMMSNFTSADLTHTFTASVSWVGQNLTNTFTGAASWVGQGLANMFTGVASWVGQGLSNAFTGVASWVGQGLSNTFSGVANWIGQGLTNVFEGVASWVSSGGLQHTFEGVADWIGQNLEHTFQGVASWVASGLSQTASVPGFAAGVQGFSGGLAVVGEFGPELVHLPQGTSVYPQSATGGFSGLDMGSMGDGGTIHITFNHTTTLSGKVVAQETIPLIAPILRSQMAVRR